MFLTMKTASGNKQETVVLQTRQKKTFNNKRFSFFPVQLSITCSKATHMLRWSKVNHFQKSAKED